MSCFSKLKASRKVLPLTKSVDADEQAMAADYISENIRVNCVCPGTTYTPSLQQRIDASPDPQAALANFVARHPMGRLGKEEEIAAAVLYLASEEAGFITGTTLLIDGGMSI